MSVSIRLSKTGKRHAPSYRVVVTQTKTKRDGKFIDIIGNYNPTDPTSDFVIDKKKYEKWVNEGALVSQAVKDLVAGRYEYVKYKPKVKQKTTSKEGADEIAEENQEESTEEVIEEESKSDKEVESGKEAEENSVNDAENEKEADENSSKDGENEKESGENADDKK